MYLRFSCKMSLQRFLPNLHDYKPPHEWWQVFLTHIFLDLGWDYAPSKPTTSWKYQRLQIPFIHVSFLTWNVLRTLRFAYSWAEASNTNPVLQWSVEYLLYFIEYCTESEEQNGSKHVDSWPFAGAVAATARHHRRGAHHTLLAQEKIRIQNWKYGSTERILPPHHRKFDEL